MLRCVAPVHGLLNGVKTLHVINEPCIATTRIGAAACRALAMGKRNYWCSGWLRRRMAQTEQAVCLLAIKVAIGCIARCTKQVLRINQPRSTLMTVCSSVMHGSLPQ
jgi:hypothetical protein